MTLNHLIYCFQKRPIVVILFFLFLDSTRAVEFKIIFIYFIQNVVAKASSETSFILSAFQTTFFWSTAPQNQKVWTTDGASMLAARDLDEMTIRDIPSHYDGSQE